MPTYSAERAQRCSAWVADRARIAPLAGREIRAKRQLCPTTLMIHVSLVEDDDRTREAWEVLLNGTPGFQCVSTHGSTEEALKSREWEKADLMVVDLNLPGLSGVELVRRLKQRRPKLLVCIFTVHEDAKKVFESLKAGASGYVLKKTPPAEVLELLAELMAGGAPMSPAIARKVTKFFQALPNASTELDRLTDRERDILHHIAQGRADKQIGDKLAISVNTVRNHVASIYQKLQVHSRMEAASKYLGR